MKKCPFCAEEIQDEAIKCRYCGSMLSGAAIRPSAAPSPSTPSGQEDIRSLLLLGKKIEAIRLVRQRRGLGLAEAKTYVEEMTKADPALAAAAPKQQSSGCLMILLVLGGVIAVVAFVLRSPSSPTPSSPLQPRTAPAISTGAKPQTTLPAKPVSPRDDLELFIQRFGTPDTDESSETEIPRPPIVTRLLTYRAERVRAAYRADVPLGSPPPYNGKWKLFGFLDPKTDAAITPAVAVERLSNRDRQRKDQRSR